ncbi:MAG: SRPBCC family protein [Planctomycetota bacterium]|nr:SRPBCC family protein [Planctomycetota bacterium]
MNCDSRLPGLSGAACRQCHAAYDHRDPSTYHTTGPILRPSTWAPGVVVAVLILVLPYLVGVASEQLGVAVFFISPAVAGYVLGVMTPPTATFFFAFTLPVVGLLVSAFLIGFEATGMFCLLIMLAIALPLIGVGALFGNRLRRRKLRRTKIPLDVFAWWLVATLVLQWAVPAPDPVAVETTTWIDAPRATVWDHLQFYEEIEREPPWLLRLGLPIPVRADGSKAAPGHRSVCRYRGGLYLVKEMEAVEPGRRLAFRVVEQNLHFEHDVTLLGGSFQLADEAGGTRLTIRTRYRPHCSPAWLWRPLEAWVLHTLHEHVAAAIERRAIPAAIARH